MCHESAGARKTAANLLAGIVNFTLRLKFSTRRTCATLATLILPAIAVDAQGAGPSVLIRCEQLSAEERARVEVRVLTELRTVRAPPGVLELTCEETSVRGGWRKDGALHDARNLSVAPGDDRTEMLLWISSLLLETAGDRSPGPAPPAGQDDPPATEGPELAPEESPALVPPAAPTEPPAQSGPPPAQENAEPGREQEKKSSPAFPFSLGAALLYGHYGTELAGSLGPELTGHLGVLGPFGGSAALSIAFGTEQPSSLTLIEGALSIGADYALFPGALLNVGPVLSFAQVSDGEVARGSLTAGVEASLRVQWPRPFGGFAQAGIRGLIDERRAVSTNQDDTVAFAGTLIPHWYPFFAIGGSYERAEH